MEAGGGKRYLEEDTELLRIPQGVTGTVVDKGSLVNYIPYLMKGLSQAFQDMGVIDMPPKVNLTVSPNVLLSAIKYLSKIISQKGQKKQKISIIILFIMLTLFTEGYIITEVETK